MANNLRQKTFTGMIWTFVKHFTLQGFAFIQGIILARLLVPEDYGLIAMTQIFFAISACFIDSGFTSALMRKKDRKEIDYSTVFVTNVFLTFSFSLLLFLCSPYIAVFYNRPILKDIVRANALLLFLNSINAVQGTRLRINLQFKVSSFISVVCNIIIGITTIIFAYWGYGVWSLIYPNYLAPILYFILYWYFQRWYPKINFSWKIWREYFAYGSKLLASNLIGNLYTNIYPLLIGKIYDAKQLGFYARGQNYSNLPINTFQGVLGSVTFPILCSIQDQDDVLRGAYCRLVRVIAFIIFPTMMGLAVLARPTVLFMITEKWENCIIFLQILCFAAMWLPFQTLNQNVLQVKGRSDLSLRMEIISKITGVIILLLSIPFGIVYLCIGQIIHSIFCLVINYIFINRIIQISIWMQIKCIFPSFVISLIMAFIVFVCTYPIISIPFEFAYDLSFIHCLYNINCKKP